MGTHANRLKSSESSHKPSILFATAEAVPFSSSGGLGMVANALPAELARQGHDITVISPWWKAVDDKEFPIKSLGTVKVPFENEECLVEVGESIQNGVRHLLIRHDDFMRSNMYNYPDDAKRFARFCRAIPQAAAQAGFTPDIVHCNDWHTGFVPLILEHSDPSLLPPGFHKTPTVMTIHRGEYIGYPQNSEKVLHWLRLPAGLNRMTHLDYDGLANSMWAGVGHAKKVVGVSKTYAKELTVEGGYTGINYRHFQNKTTGIVNGIDTDIWNPAKHPGIVQNFSADDFSQRHKNKEDLCERYGLTDPERPLISCVSRIGQEKGSGILAGSIDDLVDQGWNVIIRGAGDPAIQHLLLQAAQRHPGKVVFQKGWCPAKETQKIFSGTDCVVVPSWSEPCGLVQMEAQAFGAVPLGRKTGGIADTIEHGKTGFLFEDFTSEALVKGAQQVLDAYHDKPRWQELTKNCLQLDNSWGPSAAEYSELYAGIAKQVGQTRAG